MKVVIHEDHKTGKTWVYGGGAYHIRDFLKKLGFRWSPKERKWYYDRLRKSDPYLERKVIEYLIEQGYVKVKSFGLPDDLAHEGTIWIYEKKE